MRIALCSTYVPFVYGGARNIVEWLEVMLREAGHEVERIYLPEVDAPDAIFEQMAAFRFIDLEGSADRVICFRPQSHLIRHPRKVVWFIHHLRSFYDLWHTEYRGFPDDAHNRALREALQRVDTEALKEAHAVFTNSRVVADRLLRFNGLVGEPLFPPVFRPERFETRDYGEEVVCVCRVEHHKRQHLLIEAVQHCRTPVRVRLCGVSSNEGYTRLLQQIIAESGTQDRISIDNRWISEEEKVSSLADCLAVAYLPLDEDSYGYPTIEAALARKPALTTTDSGGVLEFVEDGVTGLVARPDPVELAAALDRFYEDRGGTIAMGERARERIATMRIDWNHVLQRLLA
ncbi:MAG: glycosyltransferase family 4 protein [Ramlibacter sp.]|nr:glycosyltransferase family 4 protein [Ramlibacter sp.]